MLSVAREGHLLVGIEFAGGVEQTQNSGVNKIVQVHVHGQVFMHPHGDGFH